MLGGDGRKHMVQLRPPAVEPHHDLVSEAAPYTVTNRLSGGLEDRVAFTLRLDDQGHRPAFP